MNDFRNYLERQLQNPGFAAEYEAQAPEYDAIRARIAARLESNAAQENEISSV